MSTTTPAPEQGIDPATWDGLRRSYIPSSPLQVDPALRLHTGAELVVDPVTYEVIRYALMNMNLEHADLLQRLCVSPVAMLSRDYQASMLTEDGELLFLGPGVQWFSNSHSMAAKWMLEHRAARIRPGDQYLCNDPWIAAAHHSDVAVFAPVFVGDELFCWVANALHMSDVGGSVPGSFCVQAEDVWQEPMSWRPIAVVAEGSLNDEVEELFLRQSRFPDLAQMDLRASIGANEATRRKVSSLVERYGANLVKSVMRRLIDAGERLFVSRLQPIPDGRWSHAAFTEAAVPGDREIYRYQVNITKEGDRLIVDNEGTDPQAAGSINVTLASLAGTTLCAIVSQLASELAGAYGGPYRRIEFRPIPGLLNCAEFPAATSPSGALTSPMLAHIAGAAVGKMLNCGDDSTRELILGPSVAHFYGPIVAGVGTDGTPYIFPDTDAMMGSLAGRPGRDGVDVGGHWWIPDGIGYNSEDIEAQYPLVMLGRHLSPAGLDGAGRHRAGVSFTETFTPRGVAESAVVFYTSDSFAKGEGLFGGGLGSLATYKLKRGSDAFERLGRGEVPSRLSEVEGESEALPFKGAPVPLQEGDVLEFVSPCSPGFGDPLRRDPAAVLADVASMVLDAETAARVYGVAIESGAVDTDATESLRLERRRERLRGADPEAEVAPPPGARKVGDLLYEVEGRWWCNGADLGPVDENYREHCPVREKPVYEIGPEFVGDDPEMAAKVVYREYVCPVTGYLIDNEIARQGASPLHDLQLHLG